MWLVVEGGNAQMNGVFRGEHRHTLRQAGKGHMAGKKVVLLHNTLEGN